MFSDSNSSQEPLKQGILKISVPHWLTQVKLYDNNYTLIKFVNEFTENHQTGCYEGQVELNAGIFEIEVSLANKVDRTLVKIKAGHTTIFEAPKTMSGHSDAVESNTGKTADKNVLWNLYKSESAGDANLCVHVLVPGNRLKEASPPVDSIFNLHRIADITRSCSPSSYIPAIDFHSDLRVSAEQGEIFLNKDLQPGYYIIEWSLSEKEKCHQLLYVHRGWTTRVFITTHSPVTNSFYMCIAAMDAVFNRDNEEEIVAQAILASFNQESGRSLFRKDQMKFLLSRECQNPWLGVLAAYALAPDLWKKTGTTEEDLQNQALFTDVLAFLQQMLPDHPDVQALGLTWDIPAAGPFYCPPLLYKGLQRVNKHAELFESTFPSGCLTDILLRSALLNSPWVNWRELSTVGTAALQSNEAMADDFGFEKIAVPVSTIDLKGIITPKAPVFNLSKKQLSSAAIVKTDIASPLSCSFSTLKEASLINTMQGITKNNYYHGMPDTLTTNSIDSLFNSLEKGNTTNIVNATNLPISRVNAGISSIMEKKKQLTGQMGQIQFNTDEQLIIRYALQNQEMVENNMEDDEDSENNIEECFSRIKTEANRIAKGTVEKSSYYLENSRAIAHDLMRIATEILKRADFIITTNAEGKIIYGNGAFIHLLSEDETSAKSQRNERLLAWEDALQTIPLGKSQLHTPFRNNLFDIWEVKRSEVNEKDQPGINCFITVLRGQDAPSLTPDQLQKITDIVSTLELFAPLFASYPEEEYTKELKTIVEGFEEVLG
ncbi:hypothetical protein FAM09_03410 [Niastella caeni]|uniref:Uncharacterized protein n=1 Tax=Niastella caeni TaxID=2569763 RepID=A0A4S8I2Z2_9BACT|nr:hypothetical protein [Niastella caeni]THU41174.1 hypothetical protein FAM09_03410 [Niastella caeni]